LDRAAGDVDVLGERLTDHPRLFVNLFDHKVPMLAFVDEDVRSSDFGWPPLRFINRPPREICALSTRASTTEVTAAKTMMIYSGCSP
jgi:hypothetical protein